MPDSLRAACGHAPEPAEIGAAARTSALQGIGELLTLEIVVDEDFLAEEPFSQIGRTVTQREFETITEAVRIQILAQLGPEADRPE